MGEENRDTPSRREEQRLMLAGMNPANRPALSVVAPCYDEQEVLPEFVRRVGAVLDGIGGASEIVLVDDGSRDGTWECHDRGGRPRPAHRRGAADAQPRPPAGAHGRPHGLPRRAHPDHRRRPAGSARTAARHDGADRPGRRRGLRPAPPARRREPVQARLRRRLLPPDRPGDRRLHPARHRRFPPHDPPRARPAARHARAPPLHPRHGGVDRRQAGPVRSTTARRGPPARANIRWPRCCASPPMPSPPSRWCR